MINIVTATQHPVASELPDDVFDYLNSGALGIVMTVGEDGYPTDAFSWVAATDKKRVRFGVDQGSKTINNLNRDGRAALQIIGPDNMVFLIKGECVQVKESLVAARPLEIALWEMQLVGARDQSWPGATPLPLMVQWAGQERGKLIRMEQDVYQEMRK